MTCGYADEPAGKGVPAAMPRDRIAFLPGTDGSALTVLFDATDGSSSGSIYHWLTTEDLGQWRGLTDDSDLNRQSHSVA